MIDMILDVLKWWGLGIPVVFIVYGISVAVDRYGREGMIDVTVVSVLWPFALIEEACNLVGYRTPRPWYYLCVIVLAVETMCLFYILWAWWV